MRLKACSPMNVSRHDSGVEALHGPNDGAALVERGYEGVAEAFFATISQGRKSGAALAVWKDGRPVISLAAGTADAEAELPFTTGEIGDRCALSSRPLVALESPDSLEGMRRVTHLGKDGVAEQVALWSVVEWRAPYSAHGEGMIGVFTGPSGRIIQREAFRIGQQELAVRFAPTEPGVWRMDVKASVDSGREETTQWIQVAAAADGRKTAHAFLKVAPGETYLEDANGAPFFWLGDTHWRFVDERWDDANKPGWTSQFRDSVDQRVAQGFSVYQVNLMMFDWGASASRYFSAGSDELDLDFLREVIDPRVAYIAEKGLVIALCLGWHQAVDEYPERVEILARHIVARYGAHAVVWTLGGEIPGYDDRLREQRLGRWRRIAQVIRDADSYGHPMTSHGTNERPLPSYYVGEPWYDFVLNQHGHGDRDLSPNHYRDFFAENPGIPMVEGETLYEGLRSVEDAGRRTVNAVMVRQAAYRAIQSGCCGFTYGAQGGWNGAWERGSFRDTWGDMAWYEGLALAAGSQLGHLRSVYEALPWHLLRPVSGCFVPGDSLNESFYSPLTTADDRRSVVVAYFDERYRLTGAGGAFIGLDNADYEVRWFDPVSGATHIVVGGHSTRMGYLSVSDPPSAQDWLLIVHSLGAS